MIKILSTVLLFIFTITTVVAYNPSVNDKKTVEILSLKINKVIDKKWEKAREIFIKKLSVIKWKIKNNDKIVYIIWELINNLNNSTKVIEDLIKQVDKEQILDISNNKNLSSLLLFQSYLSTYNNLIDGNVYWRNWEFEGGCGNYAEKWSDIYKEQFQDIYDKSNDLNNIFLMDLIKYDIDKFNKYFKSICKSDAKLDAIDFIITDISKIRENFDNAYYTELYIFYNNWYNNSYTYLKDKTPSVTCNTIWEDWDEFTYYRLEYLKKYTEKTDSERYKVYFTEIQNKFRKMMKEECNDIKIK
jgi:hypothetical protein